MVGIFFLGGGECGPGCAVPMRLRAAFLSCLVLGQRVVRTMWLPGAERRLWAFAGRGAALAGLVSSRRANLSSLLRTAPTYAGYAMGWAAQWQSA